MRGRVHRALSVAPLGVFLGALALPLACPDPCLLAGACNVDADCPSGSVCRIPRTFELGCPVVGGVCQQPAQPGYGAPCGSVEDCADDECCDPRTNTCLAARLFAGPSCDELTCRDCAATNIRERCTSDADCASDEACDLGTVLKESLCARRCQENTDCEEGERCSLDLCTTRMGTPCQLTAGLDGVPMELRCYGLTCINVDARGSTVAPYCSDNCTLEEDTCPVDGFVCHPTEEECRQR